MLVLLLFASLAPTIGPLQEQRMQAPAAVSADAEARALAGFDEETGIWFPAAATKDAYLAGDPAHPFDRDARQALEGDRELLEAVAALLADPRRQAGGAHLPPRVRQMKARFDMLVLGLRAASGERERRARVDVESDAKLVRALDRETADALPEEERVARMNALYAELEPRQRSDSRLDGALRMLGLTPANEFPMFFVLQNDPIRMEMGATPLHAGLRRVLEREAARGDARSLDYRMAVRNLDLYEGKYADALSRTNEILAGRGDDELPGNRLILGLLRKLSGDPAPLALWTARCAAASGERAGPARRPPGAECRDKAFWVSRRSVEELGAKAAHGFADVFVESIRAEPTNWPMRCEAIRGLRVVDQAACAREAAELLAVPATIAPLGARLDALTMLARVAEDRKEYGKALAACDRHLAELRFRQPPAPASLWKRLAALPAEDPVSVDVRWTWDDSPSDATWMLARKVHLALAAKDVPKARRSLIDYLATLFELLDEASGDPMLYDVADVPASDREALKRAIAESSARHAGLVQHEVRFGRDYLLGIAELENELGNKPAARRVAGYLMTQSSAGSQSSGALSHLKERLMRHEDGKADPAPIAAAETPWEPEADGAPPARKPARRAR